ncbi:MAG TPA: UvrB/UvrC motif-containing protein [Tepidisphaeraceae bacterium]|jgi:tetratricopeptide (TPR) repeat protein
MSDEKMPSSSSREARAASKDILPLLKGWDYEPGTINVRKINGLDGRPKLQMRLDLGMLQMELNGRPDGQRPHGRESLLDYYEEQLKEHTERNGTELGFHLTSSQCLSLREEAQMYYQRYLSLFVLEEYPGVIRDTDRNLRVLDMCGKYAVNEQDRLWLEQYRPYITMINVRAKASILYNEKRYREALSQIKEGLDSIREFFIRFGQEDAFGKSSEVKILRRFARDIRKKLPVDPIQKLKSQLDKAVQREAYEEAARLRDEIKRREEKAA